ncbi:MAG: PDZ domain-containing protein [Rubripirellula sp.]|nr:PDZ domain-containing protein [Rubripirellula sp.]
MNISSKSFAIKFFFLSWIGFTLIDKPLSAQDASGDDPPSITVSPSANLSLTESATLERSVDSESLNNPLAGEPIERTAKRQLDPRIQPNGRDAAPMDAATKGESVSLHRAQIGNSYSDQFTPRIDLGVILLNATPRAGVIVEAITSGGPADLAGIRAGDRLVALNHRIIKDDDSLALELRRFNASDQPTLQFVRDQRLHRIRIALVVGDDDFANHQDSLAAGPRAVLHSPGSSLGRPVGGVKQHAATTASAVGQAVLGGLGAAFEQWFQDKPVVENESAKTNDSSSTEAKRTPRGND